MIRRGRGLLARLQRDRRGTLPVELALVLPVLMLLLVGAADVTDLFDFAREVVAPLDFAANGQAYVSSIANADGNGARVSWQLASADGLSAASRVGTRGGTADLDGAITVLAREELIVAETFLEVEPSFGLLIQGPTRLHVRAPQRPRFGTVVLQQNGGPGVAPRQGRSPACAGSRAVEKVLSGWCETRVDGLRGRHRMRFDPERAGSASRPARRERGWLARLAADRRGATAISLGLLAPVVFAVTGLGIDVGVWLVDRQRLQQAVDMAALAGVQAALAGADATGTTAAATELAADNGFAAGEGTSLDVVVGGSAAQPRVQVAASRPARRWFSSLLISGDVPIRARAVASASGPGEAVCVLGLDGEAASTVDLRGNPELHTDCGVASNSVSLSSLTVVGSARLDAPLVQAAGTVQTVGAAAIESPDIRSGAAPIVDPYGPLGRDLQPPSGGGCTFNGFRANGTTTVLPGRYCGGIKIAGNGTVTFSPGVYVLYEGDLEVSGNTRLVGQDVTFVFTGGTAASIGRVKANGTLDADLSAPEASTAAYPGVLMFQDRRAPSTSGGARLTSRINGNASLRLKGALYFPSQAVEFSGSSETEGACLQIVARWVEFKGNGRTVVQGTRSNCAAIGAAALQRRSARLVE